METSPKSIVGDAVPQASPIVTDSIAAQPIVAEPKPQEATSVVDKVAIEAAQSPVDESVEMKPLDGIVKPIEEIVKSVDEVVGRSPSAEAIVVEPVKKVEHAPISETTVLTESMVEGVKPVESVSAVKSGDSSSLAAPMEVIVASAPIETIPAEIGNKPVEIVEARAETEEVESTKAPMVAVSNEVMNVKPGQYSNDDKLSEKDQIQPSSEEEILAPVAGLVDTVEHSRDMSTHLTEPVEQATKLLIDLEEQVKGYLGAEDVTNSPLSYSGNSNEQESIDRQQGQVQSLIDEVNRLSTNLEVS